MSETVLCKIEILEVMYGVIHFSITCGDQKVTISVDDTDDAMPGIMRWLEAIAVGVQECGVTIEEPGSGVRLYCERGRWLEVGSPYSREEDILLRAHVDTRQMVEEFYTKLFRKTFISEAYIKEQWEAESVGDRLRRHFYRCTNDDELLDLLLTYPRSELDRLIDKLYPEGFLGWGQSKELSEKDRDLLQLNLSNQPQVKDSFDFFNNQPENSCFSTHYDAAPLETKRNYLISELGRGSSTHFGCKLGHIRSKIIEKYISGITTPEFGIHTGKCHCCDRYGDPERCSIGSHAELAPEPTDIKIHFGWSENAHGHVKVQLRELCNFKATHVWPLHSPDSIIWQHIWKIDFRNEDDEFCTTYCSEYPLNKPLRYLRITQTIDRTQARADVAVIPYCADGISTPLRILHYNGWSMHSATPSGDTRIDFFAPFFLTDESLLGAKDVVTDIKLAALARHLYPLDDSEHEIGSKKSDWWHEATPFEYQIITCVKQVEQFQLEGELFSRMRVDFLQLEGTEPIEIWLYASHRVLDGFRPKPGDYLEGTIWLQGQVDMTAVTMIAGRNNLEGVNDALAAIVKSPGLVAGIMSVLLETVVSSDDLLVKAMYLLARLSKEHAKLIAPWHLYLSAFSDLELKPYEIARQLAQILPRLHLDDEYLVHARYTIYDMLAMDDVPTKIFALRALASIFGNRDEQLQEITETIKHLANNSDSVLKVTASQAISVLRDRDISRAHDYFEESKKLCEFHFLSLALKNIQKAIDLEPTNEEFWNHLASIISNGYHETQEGNECSNKEIVINGTFADKMLIRATSSYVVGDCEKVFEYLGKLNPEDLDDIHRFKYYAYLALCHSRLCHYEEVRANILLSNKAYICCDVSNPLVKYLHKLIEDWIILK